MPQIYNGSQSLLEKYATDGHPSYPGSGRLAIIQKGLIGNTKYAFKGPYKNPDLIGGDTSFIYSVTHTNAMGDSTTPYNGKGTGDVIDVSNTHNGVTARLNYKGGTKEDISGIPSMIHSGRDSQILLNMKTWGYGPNQPTGGEYSKPNMAANKGQVVIKD